MDASSGESDVDTLLLKAGTAIDFLDWALPETVESIATTNAPSSGEWDCEFIYTLVNFDSNVTIAFGVPFHIQVLTKNTVVRCEGNRESVFRHVASRCLHGRTMCAELICAELHILGDLWMGNAFSQ